jgi:hypothetical protein
MPIGPGKYDDLCTMVREKAKAKGVIVIVFGGDKGGGFSCQADPLTALALPEILEQVAADIRAAHQRGET